MRPRQLWRAVAFSAALFAAPAPRVEADGVRATRSPAPAQCRRTDRAIRKSIRIGHGSTVVRKDTVRLCTSHEYRFDADAGEKISINLATGKRTSFTLRTPSGDIVEGADGVKNWSGDAPEVGDYLITIGTDATAAYTLSVTLG
ncbi:MAG TPA: hypothetical protein VGB76_00940 [Pyrinomonadaceae bacterium]|jgi:hypothetical protein